jgi:CRISPR-associated endonuclease Cas2
MSLQKGNKLNRLGPNQQKILLLLFGGLGLSLAMSPKQYFRVIKEVSNEWKQIDERVLTNTIRSLYRSRLIHERENSDGSLTMILTDKGKQKVITFNIDNMEIKKPKKWDGKWRIVIFDIPERKRGARDVLRETLKRLGFFELQKSVFVYPYPCQDEMDYVIEFFDLRKYVRIITATELDNELHIKKLFHIL